MMRVDKVLKTKGEQVVSCDPNTSVADAVRLMTRHGIAALVIVDQEGRLYSLISERDIALGMGGVGGRFIGAKGRPSGEYDDSHLCVRR